MQYTLVVAKDIAIPSQDFVNRWNADPVCYAMANARLDRSTKSAYISGVTVALPILEVGAVDVDRTTLHRLIQQTLQKSRLYQPTEVVELAKPNGARVLLVKIAAT